MRGGGAGIAALCLMVRTLDILLSLSKRTPARTLEKKIDTYRHPTLWHSNEWGDAVCVHIYSGRLYGSPIMGRLLYRYRYNKETREKTGPRATATLVCNVEDDVARIYGR